MRFTNISLAIAVMSFASSIRAAPTGNIDPAQAGQDAAAGAVQQGNGGAADAAQQGNNGATSGGTLPPLPVVGGDATSALGGLGIDPNKLTGVNVDNKQLGQQITDAEATLRQLEALQDLAEDREEDGLPPTTGGGVPAASAAPKQPANGKTTTTTTAPLSTEEEDDKNNA